MKTIVVKIDNKGRFIVDVKTGLMKGEARFKLYWNMMLS